MNGCALGEPSSTTICLFIIVDKINILLETVEQSTTKNNQGCNRPDGCCHISNGPFGVLPKINLR